MSRYTGEIPIHCAYDELIKISDLKPHPKNRNKHSKEQIDRLAKIIKYQGIRSPIKVSKSSGFITAGHGRLEAFKLLKLKTVPVNNQVYTSEEQEYADVQSDNAIASWAELDLSGINTDIVDLGPDFDIDLLGIKDFVLEPADKQALCDEDEIPEKIEPKAKLGDIYQLGQHRLMCGDSTSIDDVDKVMDGEKADMVFTDPPYGISIVNNKTVGAPAKRGFVGLDGVARAKEYRAIIGDDQPFDPNLILGLGFKTIILWGANHYASRLPDKPQWIVWDKKLESGSLDHNNFSDCELAWTNQKSLSTKIYRHTWAGMLRKGNKKEELTARVHPTQKPVGLCEKIMNDFAKPMDSILDLFGGSGSTLIACEKTNRKCFMMEIDPHYVDVIIARWEKYTGNKAELLNAKTEEKDKRRTGKKPGSDKLLLRRNGVSTRL